MKTEPNPGACGLGAGLQPVVCLLAGLLQALCSGWPAGPTREGDAYWGAQTQATWVWLLQLVAAALFFWVLRARHGSSLRRTAALAGVFGFSWQVGVVWWLHIGMHEYAGVPAALSVAAVAALGCYLAMYTVLTCVLWAWVCRSLPAQRRPRRAAAPGAAPAALPASAAAAAAAAFAGAWLLAELGRAMVLTGFPWAAAGYAHLHGPLRGLAPWVGVYGTGAAAAFVAALGVGLWCHASPRWRWRQRVALVGAGVLAGALAMVLPDASFTRSSGELEVALLQGNVAQDAKFDPTRVSAALAWHTRALTRSHADLTLTPETALAVLEQDLPAEYLQRLQERVRKHPGVLLIGLPHRVGPQGQGNSLLGLGGSSSLLATAPGEVYRYQKAHRVPFAEFTPPGFAWFTALLNLPLPTFVAGPPGAPPLRLQTRRGTVQIVAPLICFEDLYGEELALRFRAPADAPTVLANASNLAWFNTSSALPQHLRIAQYRSLEFQRPTVRATNTGPTVVIDHHGQVVRALAPQTQGVLSAVVQGRSGLTPYAAWVSRTGLWPLVLLAALAIVLPALPVWRRFSAAAR